MAIKTFTIGLSDTLITGPNGRVGIMPENTQITTTIPVGFPSGPTNGNSVISSSNESPQTSPEEKLMAIKTVTLGLSDNPITGPDRRLFIMPKNTQITTTIPVGFPYGPK